VYAPANTHADADADADKDKDTDKDTDQDKDKDKDKDTDKDTYTDTHTTRTHTHVLFTQECANCAVALRARPHLFKTSTSPPIQNTHTYTQAQPQA